MASKKERTADKTEAIESLRRNWLRAGQEVSVLTAHVSRSGMSRGLRFFIAEQESDEYYADSAHRGQLLGASSYPASNSGAGPYVDRGRGQSVIREITWHVAKTGAAGMYLSRDRNSAVISGCGMDMHLHAVDSLAYTLGIPLRYRSL